MLEITIFCPTCHQKMQNWNPTIQSIKCEKCNSEYFIKNGVFHLYPGAKKEYVVEIAERRSSFAAIRNEDLNIKKYREIISAIFNNRILVNPKKCFFLDAGCGYGDLSIAASQYFEEVISIDAGDCELEYLAKRIKDKKIPNIHIFKTDICNLPFKEGQFLGIGCIQVLEHVSDVSLAIKNLYLNLDNDGILFLSTPNRYSVRREPHTKLWGIGFFPRKMGKIYAEVFGKLHEYESVNFFSLAILKKTFSEYFGKNVFFIRSGFHQSVLGKIAKWSFTKPILQNIAQNMVADFEVVAKKR